MFDRQLLHRFVQFLLELGQTRGAIRTVSRIRKSVHQIRHAFLVTNLFQTKKTPQPRLLQVVQGGIHRNSVEPSKKCGLSLESINRLESLYENILGQIRCVLTVRSHVVNHRPNPLPILYDQIVKTLHLTQLDAHDQLHIRLGFITTRRRRRMRGAGRNDAGVERHNIAKEISFAPLRQQKLRRRQTSLQHHRGFTRHRHSNARIQNAAKPTRSESTQASENRAAMQPRANLPFFGQDRLGAAPRFYQTSFFPPPLPSARWSVPIQSSYEQHP